MKRAPRCRPRHALVPWRAAKAVRGWEAPLAQRGSGQTRVCTVSVQWPQVRPSEKPLSSPGWWGEAHFPASALLFTLAVVPQGVAAPGGGGVGAQDPNPSAHSPLCRALVQHSRPLGAPWEPPGSEMYQGGTRVKAAGILAGLLVVWPSVRTLRVATVSHADVPTCYPSVLTGWSVSAERNSCLLLFGYPVSLFV